MHPAAGKSVVSSSGYDEPAGTLIKERRRGAASILTLRARRSMASDGEQLAAGMIATLSAELDGKVGRDLVADLVRAILDEGRHTVQDRSVESMMAQARQRVERLIRARTST